MQPGYKGFTQKVEVLFNHKGEAVDVAPHPKELLKVKMDHAVAPMDILRKRKEEIDE